MKNKESSILLKMLFYFILFLFFFYGLPVYLKALKTYFPTKDNPKQILMDRVSK